MVSFFFQAEDGIRDLVRSRGLGDVYKRQLPRRASCKNAKSVGQACWPWRAPRSCWPPARASSCLLYTSDAADERSSVDLGGRRIIKKKKLDKVDEQTDSAIARSDQAVQTEHIRK